jgi:hypothetical protein
MIFKLMKPRHFDGVYNHKMMDAWLLKMDIYIPYHENNWGITIDFLETYLKCHAQT